MADEVEINGVDRTLEISKNMDLKGSKLGPKMADEVAINGVDRMLEISKNEDLKGSKLMQNIEVLEKEKDELVCDNKAVRDEIISCRGVLESETVELEREIVDKKSLESVAARATELETEVSRLQHDLITAKADLAEAKKEVIELRREVENLKENDIEKGQKLDVLQDERDLLLMKIVQMNNLLRFTKKAGDEKVRRLNKKLEERESETGEKSMYGVKLQWPFLTASTGVVVTVGALWYLRVKQR